MTDRLITFLGKARKTDGGEYQEAHYDFDGVIKKTQFFGLALTEVIRPKQLFVLGTPGSMWDVFLLDLPENEHFAALFSALTDAVENDSVNQTLLDSFQGLLSQKLDLDCQLKIIPYGINETEQVDILNIMADGVDLGASVAVDITHGLRHLPMLGFLSAMYLQTARQAKIVGIYYGAFERKENGITPVIKLEGLLKIADWISALHGFDNTGDIAPFAPLLEDEGVKPETASLLKTAAFYEGVLNISQAGNHLSTFTKKTENGLPDGIASLFADSLKERISWKNDNSLYQRQRKQAKFYLKQGDYLRATLLGYEAIITGYMEKHKVSDKVLDYVEREKNKGLLESELKSLNQEYKVKYYLLRSIRNVLAHSNQPEEPEVEQALKNEQKLLETLNALFNNLLPKTP